MSDSSEVKILASKDIFNFSFTAFSLCSIYDSMPRWFALQVQWCEIPLVDAICLYYAPKIEDREYNVPYMPKKYKSRKIVIVMSLSKLLITDE